jgi:hypothetical protein
MCTGVVISSKSTTGMDKRTLPSFKANLDMLSAFDGQPEIKVTSAVRWIIALIIKHLQCTCAVT